MKAYHIRLKDGENSTAMDTTDPMEGSSGARRSAGAFGGDVVDLTESSLPFVDYNSFIGSDRPVKAKQLCPPEVPRDPGPSTSGYKQPVIKIR